MTEPILEGTALYKRFGKDDALRRTETRWTVPSTPSRSSSASGPRMAGRLSTASDAEKRVVARRAAVPISYNDFRQRVRRHRRTDVLRMVAAVNAAFERARYDKGSPPPVTNTMQPFTLAGVARTALISGNDHRSATLKATDLQEMCDAFANIVDPALKTEAGSRQSRAIFNRATYEQFGDQVSPMEGIGRTLSLLYDHAPSCPTAPTPEDWVDALGVFLELFQRLGFAMFVAAVNNVGQIHRDTLLMKHVAPVFKPLTSEQGLAAIERWFTANLGDLKQTGLDSEVRGYEKWSLNPLVDRPIVALADGHYVIPWPHLILDRITPTGLYFIGLEAFGSKFPDSLGKVFESYVGTQLRLLESADVAIVPEIVYGSDRKLTVDYFLVTPEVVVLVEVKTARPIWSTRLGQSPGDDDIKEKVGKAYAQIDETAKLITQGHPELQAIPSDRPCCALVVTLEPFHLINTSLYDDVVTRPSIPTVVVSAHELEGTVATLGRRNDTGIRLLAALTSDDDHHARLSHATQGLASAPNPVLVAAWDRFIPEGSAKAIVQARPDDPSS